MAARKCRICNQQREETQFPCSGSNNVKNRCLVPNESFGGKSCHDRGKSDFDNIRDQGRNRAHRAKAQGKPITNQDVLNAVLHSTKMLHNGYLKTLVENGKKPPQMRINPVTILWDGDTADPNRI